MTGLFLKTILISGVGLVSAAAWSAGPATTATAVATTAPVPQAAPAPPIADDLVVIVNSENPASSIKESDLRDYFFKRKRQWPDGTVVRFLDRTPDVPARKTFLKNILKKSSEDVDLFWIGQKLYSGDSAPLREPSDAMTVQFVESFKGAIGYLTNPSLAAGKNVKIVKVE